MSRQLRTCEALSCMNNSQNSALSFFRFSEGDPKRFEKWMAGIKMKNSASKLKYLCSDHFEEKYFTSTLRRRLLPEAVPSLPPKDQFQEEECPQDSCFTEQMKKGMAFKETSNTWNSEAEDGNFNSDSTTSPLVIYPTPKCELSNQVSYKENSLSLTSKSGIQRYKVSVHRMKKMISHKIAHVNSRQRPLNQSKRWCHLVKATKNPKLYCTSSKLLNENSHLNVKHFDSLHFMTANDKKSVVLPAVAEDPEPVHNGDLLHSCLSQEVISNSSVKDFVDADVCYDVSLQSSTSQAHGLNSPEYIPEHSMDIEMETKETSKVKTELPLEKGIWLWEKEEHEKQMAVLEQELIHQQQRLKLQHVEHEKRVAQMQQYHAMQMKNMAELYAAERAIIKKDGSYRKHKGRSARYIRHTSIKEKASRPFLECKKKV